MLKCTICTKNKVFQFVRGTRAGYCARHIQHMRGKDQIVTLKRRRYREKFRQNWIRIW